MRFPKETDNSGGVSRFFMYKRTQTCYEVIQVFYHAIHVCISSVGPGYMLGGVDLLLSGSVFRLVPWQTRQHYALLCSAGQSMDFPERLGPLSLELSTTSHCCCCWRERDMLHGMDKMFREGHCRMFQHLLLVLVALCINTLSNST